MSDQGARRRIRRIRRIEGWATASAVIAGAVAVAFGTGFTAGRTVLADAGAWLSSGTTVSHVNAGTGRPDATIDDELVGEVGDQAVVDSTSGTAVVDVGEGTVTTLDTTAMTPGATAPLPDGTGRNRFVVAGRLGYLLGDTVVQPVDPTTLEHQGPALDVGHLSGAVATAEGTLVVLDGEAGTAIELVDGVAQMPVVVTRRPSVDHLALTAVGGRPVVVDSRAGRVRRLGPGAEPDDAIRVPGLARVAVGDVAIADPHADGLALWLVRRETGTLIGVHLDTGEVHSGELDRRGASLQEPVVLEGLVYVPHGDSHDVTVVEVRGGELHQLARHEPEGSSARLEVFAQDRRVWINDPAAGRALVVEPDGTTVTVVDKGTGRGADGREGDPGSSPEPGPVPAPAPSAAVPEPAPVPPPSPPRPVDAAQVDVPRVVGLPRQEACEQIQAAQLVCDDRPTPDAPGDADRDDVVRQSPSGGWAPVFSAVVVEHYAPGGVPVPDLSGLRVTQGGAPQNGPACQAVVQAGFRCAPRAVAAADGQPADQVLARSQQPTAGADEAPGGDVTFDYAAHTRVPSLSGLTAEQACAQVTALNLRCTVQAVTVGATPNRVASQDPAPGTELPADSPATPSQVTIQVPQRTSVVPNMFGMDHAGACAALSAEGLGCSWEANPVNSIRNPGLADQQSIAAGTPVAPGTVVSVYHPAGPDATLHRYLARHMDGERFWAIAPNQGPGQASYNYIQTHPGKWAPNGTVGHCYSTPVQGSIALYGFKRPTPGDEDPAYHYYAAGGPGTPNYDRGARYYPPSEGGRVQLLCYVIPWDGAAGAAYVIEWTKRGTAGHHFYTATGEPSPGGEYRQFTGQWMTW